MKELNYRKRALFFLPSLFRPHTIYEVVFTGWET